ncbi:glycosyltransferase [Campylobacter sp. JMF_08 NE1]|uniref:glycosyltransferase n=1 Tax=Campylobacter sp. JMF_08 NE1 TaxID=2983821 RepID=UPI0022E9D5DA|nr:glycosyltransferase [Campylobacter sp. JMF_08 NE1]MDA3048348.1 glycosyltransferase [Campylobacter sp. JMF_08 NE1]
MKILFVISRLANGGAERVLQVLTNFLCVKYEICIAILEDNKQRYNFDKRIKFLYLNVYKNGGKFDKYKILRQCFKTESPNLIISFMDWTNVACVISNFGLSYPLIVTEHNTHSYLQNKFFAKIRDICYKRADFLTVLNEDDKKYYSKFTKNCEVMYNPYFGNSLKDITLKENIILSVGRLETVKGYDIYFKALSLIDKKLLNKYEVQIAGDGSQRQNLKNLAKELNLKINFLGHQENISKFYEKAKIFVISSVDEGFGNVLVEAAFNKCARISSDTVGAKEIIKDKFDGILFKIGDEKELAQKLSNLMQDENLQKQLIKNAEIGLDKFKAENIILKWENLIKNIAK